MNRPFRTGGAARHWLRKLLDCPSVAVIDADPLSAHLEVAGVTGNACMAEAGLCIGLRLDLREPPQDWLAESTLALAASPFSCDDALAVDDGAWMLWHRYDHALDATQLEQRLATQLALARRLIDGARPPEGGPGSDIGKLI